MATDAWADSPDTDRSSQPNLFLASLPLFAGVDPGVLEVFERDTTRILLAGGDILFRQGDSADAMFVVVRGSLQVIVEDAPGAPRLVDTLGRGAIIGEMALLLNEIRSATMMACRDSELMRIRKSEFDRLCVRHPQVALELARLLGVRLKRTTHAVSRPRGVHSVAVIPAGSGDAWRDFGARLVAALIADGRPAILASPALAEAISPGAADAELNTAASHRLFQWMSECEDRFDYVVYEGDPSHAAWTRRALRQADVVLLVARADDDPVAAAADAGLGEPGPGRTPIELILVHPADTVRANGTARWLENRHIARHHHIRAGVDADYRRLARRLTGRAIGLVLSGGGARGFAHIGVIKAMRAHGIPIDFIGGTSMGAVIAGLYASGNDPDAMTMLTKRAYVGPQEFDLTVPMVALNKASATVRKMKRLFGETQMEDLLTPCFCVSTNLSRAESVVHDRGPLWLWTRVSCAIPGLVPPVAYEGELLVDGGLLNNLPADVMRSRCNGFVIGVDVTRGVDLTTTAELQPDMSGWPHLWKRLKRSEPQLTFPTIVEILTRTVLVSSIRDAAHMQTHCDRYLRPDVGRFGMSDFKAIDAIIDAGHDAAETDLRGWYAQVTTSSRV